MAVIPGYDSKQNINANIAEPTRNEADIPFKQQQQVMSTLQDVTQKWSDANDVMQYTEAKAKYEVAASDIQARAAADPNFKDSAKYFAELDKAKSLNLSGINNKQVVEKAALEFDYGNQIAKIKIGSQAKEKQLEYNKVMVKSNLDTLLQKKLSAATPAEAMQYDHQINNVLDLNVRSGVLTYAEADKQLKDSQKTSVQYEIYNDPSTQETQSTLLKELRDPNGKYEYLDPDTRLSLIEESQRRIFQNNQTYKREVEQSQVKRNDGFIEKLAGQTANFKDIDNEEKIPEDQGGIKRTVLLQYRRFLQSGVEKTLNDMIREKNPNTKEATQRSRMATEYNDLIENYLSDKTDQWKAKELLAKSLADGVIDADELKVLSPIKDGLKDVKFNKDTSPIASVVKQVKSWMGNSNASSENIATRLKQMIGGIGDGGQPQAEMGKIMDAEMLKHFPDYSTYPKEGKNYLDKKSSRAYKIFSDGKWAWIEGQKQQ